MARSRPRSNRSRSQAPGRSGRRAPASSLGASYPELSTRPLHILVFLAPFLIGYEIGSIVYLAEPGTDVLQDVAARRLIAEFFHVFGAVGLHLPGMALVAVLLIQHLLSKDGWSVRAWVPPGMALESAAWTMPLVLLAALMLGPGPAAVLTQADDLGAWPWQARATIAIGAGLYEELLFRMLLIAGVHLLVVDVLRAPDRAGKLVAVAVSALAFAFYHDLSTPGGGTDLVKAAFFAAAGAYLGVLYLWRGFGIVVATHILYNIVVLVVVPG